MKSILWTLLFCLLSLPVQAERVRADAHHNVMENKTLRCGYTIMEPYVTKDLSTGKVSGITVDFINELASEQGLAVTWDQEVTIDQIVPSLDSGKFDLFCTPSSPNKTWDAMATFTGGFGSLPYYVYVADKSTLTPEAIATARFSVIDGFIPAIVTRDKFPQAQINSLPQTTSMGELYDQIRFDKADAVLNEHMTAINYMRNNPGILRKMSLDPVIIMPMHFIASRRNGTLAAFADKNLNTQTDRGKELLKELIEKYNLAPGTVYLETAPREY